MRRFAQFLFGFSYFVETRFTQFFIGGFNAFLAFFAAFVNGEKCVLLHTSPAVYANLTTTNQMINATMQIAPIIHLIFLALLSSMGL